MAKKRQRTSLGILFWVAFILLVMVVFLVNRPRIQSVLESTQLIDVIQRRISPDEEITDVDLDRTDDSELDSEEQAPDLRPDEPAPPDSTPDATPEVETDILPDEEPPRTPDSDETTDITESEPTTQPEPGETPAPPDDPSRSLAGTLYYIRVTDDGRIHPEGVSRTIEYTDAPLTRSIESLLSGPTTDELSSGLLNLIPDGTQLLSASVRNGVAYLNFNEAFRFNPMGVEGYRAQLQQIIYSTTEFSTIDRVQILIEGQNVEWLGGEGVYIGAPLGRDSFS